MTIINTNKMTPTEQIDRGDESDELSLGCLSNEAQSFLLKHKWCKKIKRSFLDTGIEGVLAVFYFEIDPFGTDVDNSVWVIVGDLPPAYIAIENCPNGTCALDAYVGEMEKWVKAVKEKRTVEDLIPVNSPPTLEYAELLEKRLKFIDKHILPNYKKGLI